MTTAASRRSSDRRISPVFVGIVAVMAVTGWATWTGFAEQPGVAVFLFVTAAWIVSLCLHEYAHARTALHSGDISIGAKGDPTLNPLKYTHALLSIVLPVIFVIMGGIGLPGGAVFIERNRIQGRWKHSLGGGSADERAVRRRVHGAVLAARPGRRAAGLPVRAGVPRAAPGHGRAPELPAGPGPGRLRRDRAWLSYNVKRQASRSPRSACCSCSRCCGSRR